MSGRGKNIAYVYFYDCDANRALLGILNECDAIYGAGIRDIVLGLDGAVPHLLGGRGSTPARTLARFVKHHEHHEIPSNIFLHLSLLSSTQDTLPYFRFSRWMN
jgi:hypothetical protein